MINESPSPNLKRNLEVSGSSNDSPPPKKIWSPVDESLDNGKKKNAFGVGNKMFGGEIDYSLPITTTYLKYMRSLGCTDEDALKFEKVSDFCFFFILSRSIYRRGEKIER